MKIVFDTSVLISGLLTPHGTCARVVDLYLGGWLELCVDDRIAAGYAEVLQHPELRIEPRDARELLAHISTAGQRVSALPLQVDLPDLNDLPFLEVARAAGAVLGTGNLRHFPKEGRAGVDVVTPRALLAQFGHG